MRRLKIIPVIRIEKGDTIVEVLISVAVISLVLAGSYAIANRNVATTQDTQEHAQALQLAQREVEGLRALAGSFTGACITGVTPTPTPAGNCASINPDTTPCSNQPCYGVSITNNSAGIFEVIVKWTSINGGNAQVTLDYGI